MSSPSRRVTVSAYVPRRRHEPSIWLWIVFLPPLLYFALRPDDFGLVPNALDPLFYTGYAFNLDDAIVAAGQSHYFVSRWSVYYPMHLLGRIFHPEVARLLWRWILAVGVGWAISSLGARVRLTLKSRVFLVFLVLTAPVFLRSLFTDYVDYTVVAVGIILIGLTLRESFPWPVGVGIGVCVAFMVVANPLSIVPAGLMCIAAFVLCNEGWRSRCVLAVVALLACGATVAAAMVWFRWRYGVDNIYAPTMEFIRTFNGPGPWRAKTLDWMGRRLWIYLPVVVLITAAIERAVWRQPWSRVTKAALILLVAENVWQIYEQFANGSILLEVPFYWSFGVPALIAGVVVVLGRLADRVQPAYLAGLGLALAVYLQVGSPSWLRLPQGPYFVALGIALAVVVYLLLRRNAVTIALTVVIALMVQMQIGVPPLYPNGAEVDSAPYYEWVYRGSGPLFPLDELLWFGDAMDTVPNDAHTTFVPFGLGSWMTALYEAHVSGHLLAVGPDETVPEAALTQIASDSPDPVAFVGPTAAVESARSQVLTASPSANIILDETYPGDRDMRLIVVIPG